MHSAHSSVLCIGYVSSMYVHLDEPQFQRLAPGAAPPAVHGELEEGEGGGEDCREDGGPLPRCDGSHCTAHVLRQLKNRNGSRFQKPVL